MTGRNALLQPDTRHNAYVAQDKGACFAVVDGVESKERFLGSSRTRTWSLTRRMPSMFWASSSHLTEDWAEPVPVEVEQPD
jgi:hypothetical protein